MLGSVGPGRALSLPKESLSSLNRDLRDASLSPSPVVTALPTPSRFSLLALAVPLDVTSCGKHREICHFPFVVTKS